MTDYLDPNTIDITDTEYVPDADDTAGYGTPLLSAADAEQINAEVLAEASRSRATVYRSPRFEQEQAEREQAAQERAQQHAARIAAGGGDEVTTELRGEAGARVAEVLRLEEVTSAASKLAHRVNDEADALEAERAHGERERLDAALHAAWTDAENKRKVPDIVGPLMRWDEHERLEGNPDRFRRAALARINAQRADRNLARLLERADDVDEALQEVAGDILAAAGTAADVLTAAGLTVDATAEQVVEQGDPTTLPAWKAWREAVSRWGDLQSARRWFEVAHVTGFDPRRPDEVGDFDPRSEDERMRLGRESRETRERRRGVVEQAERDTWGTQFGTAVPLPRRVDSPAAALSWWNENGRPAGEGVGPYDVQTGAEA